MNGFKCLSCALPKLKDKKEPAKALRAFTAEE